MRWWIVALILLATGGTAALLAYGFTTDPQAILSTLTGKPAPEFSLTLFDGRTVRLSDFRGKVVFLMMLITAAAIYGLWFQPAAISRKSSWEEKPTVDRPAHLPRGPNDRCAML